MDACDLCLADDAVIVSEPNPPQQGRIALCRRCGLFYSRPRLTPEALESFYRSDFTGDAGAQAISGEEGLPTPKKVRSEERRAKRWGLPLVLQHIDLNKKTVLDLRSRSGALASAMTEEGAQVIPVDPFPANLDYARKHRKLGRAQQMSMTELHRLADIPSASIDAVTALTVHLLAHLLSPREFLHNALRVLKPGGWLFLLEKDVLQPNYNVARPTPFASGQAHQYHFTRDSMALYLKAAGFEVVQCTIDPIQATGQNRVIVVVARKPDSAVTPADLFLQPVAITPILAKARRIERFWYGYALWGKGRRKWRKIKRLLQPLS
ncbi:MAG: class I SAM-dependent methyltransferase [Methylohalobius sp. ZOD2]